MERTAAVMPTAGHRGGRADDEAFWSPSAKQVVAIEWQNGYAGMLVRATCGTQPLDAAGKRRAGGATRTRAHAHGTWHVAHGTWHVAPVHPTHPMPPRPQWLRPQIPFPSRAGRTPQPPIGVAARVGVTAVCGRVRRPQQNRRQQQQLLLLQLLARVLMVAVVVLLVAALCCDFRDCRVQRGHQVPAHHHADAEAGVRCHEHP